MRTLVKKFRRCQSLPGRNLTRVDLFAPGWGAWRTIFRLFEKGIGTVVQPYKLAGVNQKDSRRAKRLALFEQKADLRVEMQVRLRTLTPEDRHCDRNRSGA
jgi:hypothetical protein